MGWLSQHQLMDYSLLVAIKDSGDPDAFASERSGLSTLAQCSGVMQEQSGAERAVTLHISIIDFLQKWTVGKQIARCIKVAERNKATVPPSAYADRFLRHFEARIQAVARPPASD